MSQLEKDEKAKNSKRLKQGEKPVFMSKAEKQARQMINKYEELKSRDAVTNYIKKRNKKKMAKSAIDKF